MKKEKFQSLNILDQMNQSFLNKFFCSSRKSLVHNILISLLKKSNGYNLKKTFYNLNNNAIYVLISVLYDMILKNENYFLLSYLIFYLWKILRKRKISIIIIKNLVCKLIFHLIIKYINLIHFSTINSLIYKIGI
uniref:Uncharacterized protein n=1 Tax=Amorphochlora amoebiformis TaxID=1561963 RepID=A0A0H5BLD0_9EUKA|nr:hypothetical protein [Amorphochlora amoebiformis]